MEHVKTSQWTELNHDLLHEIGKLLYCYDDYYRFRAVCKRWNMVLPHIPKRPWLVLPFNDKAIETHIAKKKIYYVKLPEMQNKKFRGSCCGWLMVVHFDGTLQMLNPFTRKHNNLPPISTFPYIFEYNPERGNPYTLKDLQYFGVGGNILDNEEVGHHDDDSNDDGEDDDGESYDEGDDPNKDSYDEVNNSDEGDDDSYGDCDEDGDDTFDGDYHEQSDDTNFNVTTYHDRLNGTYRVSNKFIYKFYIKKIIISSPPEDNYTQKNFIAVAIYGLYNRLAFCKHGDKKWTDIPKLQKDDVDDDNNYEDVIFHEDKIYVINSFTQIFEFDIKNHDTPLGRIIEIPKPHDLHFFAANWKMVYLIGCLDGGLVMVIRHFNFPFIPNISVRSTISHKFDIYKLDKGEKQWSRVFDLKNYAIFIGFNSSILMSANVFPNGWENRIHYTDDIESSQVSATIRGHDIGLFNFNDGKSTQLFPDTPFPYPPPIWLV